MPRNLTESAVVDLILLSRSKRAPAEYILTGYVWVYFRPVLHKGDLIKRLTEWLDTDDDDDFYSYGSQLAGLVYKLCNSKAHAKVTK